MDARYAFLILMGIIGIWAYFETEPGYREAWLMIGVVALIWAAVVALRNWYRPGGRRFKR